MTGIVYPFNAAVASMFRPSSSFFPGSSPPPAPHPHAIPFCMDLLLLGFVLPAALLGLFTNRASVPRNAMRVVCGNCDTPFVFKEYEETCEVRSAWEAVASQLVAAVTGAEEASGEVASERDKAELEVNITSQPPAPRSNEGNLVLS